MYRGKRLVESFWKRRGSMKNRITVKFCVVVFALLSAISMSAAMAADNGILAIAFTGEGYTCIAWKIEDEGTFDLKDGFDLPNDTLCSIKVKPGYKVTLFEHENFSGEQLTLDSDTPTLPENWKRQTSSLVVEPNPDYEEKWQEAAEDVNEYTPTQTTTMTSKQMERATRRYKDMITPLMDWSSMNWRRELDDAGRVQKAETMLDFFSACGFDVSQWTPDTLAQQINNFCDWRPDSNVLQVAVMVLGIDPSGPQ